MKIVHHYSNGRFDWLSSEHQSVNLSKEAIFKRSGKYKRFTFVHLVLWIFIILDKEMNKSFIVKEER